MRKSLVTLVALGCVLAACGDDGGSADPADGGDVSGAMVLIDNFSFSGADSVVVGTSVLARNEDSATHTWTSDDGLWDSDRLDSGENFTRTFDEAGTFAFHCEIHPSMTGSITVTG